MKNNKTKMIPGIDTLYYFYESNENYDNMFIELIDQLDTERKRFELDKLDVQKDKLVSANNIKIKTHDLHVTIKDNSFAYLNKNDGFYWFKDSNNFFKIGFKDKLKNTGLHDIQVQFMAIGIYTLGVYSLIKYLDDLLKEFITGNKQVTRIDLNCFVQYDFSFLTKEMFATRKQKYTMITEIGNASKLQTMYVGKKPFLLRIYDKKEELKKSDKNELMYQHFMNNEFDLEQPIFNIEFEMHRTHLRGYNLLTVDEVLNYSVVLFKKAMEEIRLIDINTLSDNAIDNNNKHRADTLDIWDYIKENYNLRDSINNVFELQRVKRILNKYTYEKFEDEIIRTLKKAKVNRIMFNEMTLEKLFNNVMYPNSKEVTLTQKDVSNDVTKENYLIDENKNIHKEIKFPNKLSDLELKKYFDEVREIRSLSKKNRAIYHIVRKEMIRREMLEQPEQLDFKVELEKTAINF